MGLDFLLLHFATGLLHYVSVLKSPLIRAFILYLQHLLIHYFLSDPDGMVLIAG